MRFVDYIKLLTPYTLSASYTLPELANIAFGRTHAYASDGISSLAIESPGQPTDFCVKAVGVSTWVGSVGEERPVVSGLMDGNLKLIVRLPEGDTATSTFPTAPLSSYRLSVDTAIPQQATDIAVMEDSMPLADALGYVLKRSGTDSTFKWASGVTLRFSEGRLGCYMTDNITMAVGACDLESTQEGTWMITHGAAQRLQGLAASYAGEVRISYFEGKLFVQVNDAVFSTVVVDGAAEVENYLEHIDKFADLDTFDPGPEFINVIRRHGQFAGREGASTCIRIKGNEVLVFTSNEAGRIKDRLSLNGAPGDCEICTGASVLARMLGDGARLAITEDAAMTVDPRGNVALLCAWDDQPEADRG